MWRGFYRCATTSDRLYYKFEFEFAIFEIIFVMVGQFRVGNFDNFVKQKISVLNETKRDKILFKPKVYDIENLCAIPLIFCYSYRRKLANFQPFFSA
jgi:hypothetical protein